MAGFFCAAIPTYLRKVIYEELHPETLHGGASPRKALDRIRHAI
jgi:hypothetical protein